MVVLFKTHTENVKSSHQSDLAQKFLVSIKGYKKGFFVISTKTMRFVKKAVMAKIIWKNYLVILFDLKLLNSKHPQTQNNSMNTDTSIMYPFQNKAVILR